MAFHFDVGSDGLMVVPVLIVPEGFTRLIGGDLCPAARTESQPGLAQFLACSLEPLEITFVHMLPVQKSPNGDAPTSVLVHIRASTSNSPQRSDPRASSMEAPPLPYAVLPSSDVALA